MSERRHSFLEFFCGGGFARAGLGSRWDCELANDIDAKKGRTYAENWGSDRLRVADINELGVNDMPRSRSDLAWASFPCQDLSLAGVQKGLGAESDNAQTRSGAFWPFLRLMDEMSAVVRAPRVIALENVYGALTSHQGDDFKTLITAFAQRGYQIGALVIDARAFVPQSRPRVFVIATRMAIPDALKDDVPQRPWHVPAMIKTVGELPTIIRDKWVWWKLPTPVERTSTLLDLLEDDPKSVTWNTPAKTQGLISMMTPIHLKKLEQAKKSGKREVGGLYRRTRVENGEKMQRVEIRFDDVAGCLRTPSGGSSRQTLMIVEGGQIRSRLISARETARLMGLPESYILPEIYNDAYHVTGDAVVVPVVRQICEFIIEPLLEVKIP